MITDYQKNCLELQKVLFDSIIQKLKEYNTNKENPVPFNRAWKELINYYEKIK